MSLSIKFGQIFDASLNALVKFLLVFYRAVLSPFLGGNCRFEPSCSIYAQQAFSRFHFRKAFGLTAKRVLSCRPGGSFGFDPCPCNTRSSNQKGTIYESAI